MYLFLIWCRLLTSDVIIQLVCTFLVFSSGHQQTLKDIMIHMLFTFPFSPQKQTIRDTVSKDKTDWSNSAEVGKSYRNFCCESEFSCICYTHTYYIHIYMYVNLLQEIPASFKIMVWCNSFTLCHFIETLVHILH